MRRPTKFIGGKSLIVAYRKIVVVGVCVYAFCTALHIGRVYATRVISKQHNSIAIEWNSKAIFHAHAHALNEPNRVIITFRKGCTVKLNCRADAFKMHALKKRENNLNRFE